MSKRRKPTAKSTHLGTILWLGALAILTVAGFLAWHGKTVPATVFPAYTEPGWVPQHESARWTCIVIHHSAGEHGAAESFDEEHRKRGWDGLGYDFVIGNGSQSADGEVEVGYRWADQLTGAHCKTEDHYYNEHGIGICLVGNLDNHPPTEKQMQNLTRLVRFLSGEFRIAPAQIFTHGGVTGKTACPGRHFDVEAFRQTMRRQVRHPRDAAF
jgi:hypothetical protein